MENIFKKTKEKIYKTSELFVGNLGELDFIIDSNKIDEEFKTENIFILEELSDEEIMNYLDYDRNLILHGPFYYSNRIESDKTRYFKVITMNEKIVPFIDYKNVHYSKYIKVKDCEVEAVNNILPLSFLQISDKLPNKLTLSQIEKAQNIIRKSVSRVNHKEEIEL